MPHIRIARLLASAAGALDFCTGAGLVFAPALVLPLMGINLPAGEGLVYLRFVGAFVSGVGACYLWALWRGDLGRLRAALEFTVLFRLAAGGFTAVAVAREWLMPAWLSVTLTDGALALAQIWLLFKLPSHDATHSHE